MNYNTYKLTMMFTIKKKTLKKKNNVDGLKI